jgi:hypothetical protein
VALFLGNLDTYMNEVDSLIDENQSKLVTDALAVSAALTEMNVKLNDLETNANSNATTIGSLLTAQSGYLTTFLATFAAKLAELDTNYTAHLAQITTLLAEADTDLATFAAAQSPQLTAIAQLYTNYANELDDLLTTAATDLTIISTDIDTILAQLEADYTPVSTQVTALLASGTSALNTYATDYDTTLDLLTTDYTSVAAELDSARTASMNVLNSHVTAYNAETANLEPDYDVHAVTATAFLVDLGATERARIIEQFAASLATQLQQLVDRGLYSAAIASDVTARNTRDRDEQIQMLNDRLNREKWENQHRIYEQQVAMRARVMDAKDRIHTVEQEIRRDHVGQITSRFGLQQSARDRTLAGVDRLHAVKQEVWKYQASQIVGIYQLLLGVRDRTLEGKKTLASFRDANVRLNIEIQNRLHESGQAVKRLLIDEAARLQQLEYAITQWKTTQRDRLLEQVNGIVAQRAAGLDRQHTLQQEVSRVAMTERDTLLAQLQDAVKGFISGKDRYAAATMANASTMADHRHKAIVEKMNEAAARLTGLREQHAENMRLMIYQLDERNKLLIGLYGFVERREDDPPSFDALTQICTGLGDAGGGWVTP